MFHRDIHNSDLMKGFPPPTDQRVTMENFWSTRPTHSVGLN